MTKEELMYASPEDQAFYLKCVRGLPIIPEGGLGLNVEPLPYGLGPHSVRCLREVVKIVNPKRMFEIGFNMGWSASMWLELSESLLNSCDISKKEETIQAAKILTDRYGDRFCYMDARSFDMDSDFDADYDLIFIDGGHLIDDVKKDIRTSFNWHIKYLVFDDILPEFGQVQEAIDLFGEQLSLVKEMGNIALYKNNII